MRILMLAQFYPPIMGGIERHVKNLGSALALRGHKVAVATLRHPGQPEFEMDGDVRVYRVRGTMQRVAALFSVDRQHHPPFPDPETTLEIRRVVAEERPQIVHAHNWIVQSFLPLKAWSGAKLVRTLHDSELMCVQMRLMYRDTIPCSGPEFGKCLDCAAHHYGRVKGAATLSGNWTTNHVERALVDEYLPVSMAIAKSNGLLTGRTPFQVVPNFVPDDVAQVPPHLDIADPRLASLPPRGFILQAGDLSPDKGINVLLDAYAGMEAPPPLVLIGRRVPQSPDNFPPGVTVIEGLPHDLLMEAWRRSLFAVVASTGVDACPTTTIEAMACGKAVVGTLTGGIVDQIEDGETGFLVPPGDPVALRGAMARLVAEPELRDRMGIAGERRSSAFKAHAVVSQVEKIYESLCNRC